MPAGSCASTAAASKPSSRGPFVMPRWTFALRASEEAWATFWQPVPPPGFHDLIAMLKTRALKLEGDQHPFFANLRYFKELLALPRPPRRAAADEQARIRARRRPLSAARHPGPTAPALCRGGRRRHPAAVPAHRRCRQPPIPRPPQRRGGPRQVSRHRLRPALARQVLAAGGLAQGRVQAHLARLCRHHHGRRRCARARQAGGDGLLDRRAHRAAPGARARCALPRPHRPGVRRPRRALLRPRLAAPSGRARRRGVRGHDLRPDRAHRARGRPLGDDLALHAGRPRRVQGRSAFLYRRRRRARPRRRDRHRQMPALPADRRVRLLLHARRHPRAGPPHQGRGGDRHGRARPLPHERGPGAVPGLPAAGAGEHPETGTRNHDTHRPLQGRARARHRLGLQHRPRDRAGAGARGCGGALRRHRCGAQRRRRRRDRQGRWRRRVGDRRSRHRRRLAHGAAGHRPADPPARALGLAGAPRDRHRAHRLGGDLGRHGQHQRALGLFHRPRARAGA